MYGAIIGDIVGSRFEFNNTSSKNFDFFSPYCTYTDDTVMTIAIAAALTHHKLSDTPLDVATIYWMQRLGRKHINAGYGGNFYNWIRSEKPKPYNSWGNGSAMRVSACGIAAQDLAEALNFAEVTASVTHNHKEGIKGAKAIAASIYKAKIGMNKDAIQSYIEKHFYPLNFSIDEIKLSYQYFESCQDTVPQAIKVFLESESFEDCIRLAISLGGDSDTIAAMAGSIAEQYYGIPEEFKLKVRDYLDKDLLKILDYTEGILYEAL